MEETITLPIYKFIILTLGVSFIVSAILSGFVKYKIHTASINSKRKQYGITLENLRDVERQVEERNNTLCVSALLKMSLKDIQEVRDKIDTDISYFMELETPEGGEEIMEKVKMLSLFASALVTYAESLIEAKERVGAETVLDIPSNTELSIKVRLPKVKYFF